MLHGPDRGIESMPKIYKNNLGTVLGRDMDHKEDTCHSRGKRHVSPISVLIG